MTNLEWLNKLKRDDDGYSDIETSKYEFRTAKALEIIAEELINNNSTLRTLVTTLENIETAIKRG